MMRQKTFRMIALGALTLGFGSAGIARAQSSSEIGSRIAALEEERTRLATVERLEKQHPGLTPEGIDALIARKRADLASTSVLGGTAKRTLVTGAIALPALSLIGGVIHNLGQIGTGQSSTFLQSVGKAFKGLINPKIGLPLLAVTAGAWAFQQWRAAGKREAATNREIADLGVLRDALVRRQGGFVDPEADDPGFRDTRDLPRPDQVGAPPGDDDLRIRD